MRSDIYGPIRGQHMGDVASNPGLIATITTLDVALAVPGVRQNDILVVNPTSDLEAGIFVDRMARCGADGTLVVRYGNVTVGGVDPAAHSLRVWRFPGTFPAGTLVRQGKYGPIVGRDLGTIAVDGPNIPASTSADVVVAVPGARVGDTIIAQGEQGTAFSAGVDIGHARVSANDQVTLRLINYSIGAVDPASENIRFYALGRAHARGQTGVVRAQFLGTQALDFANTGARSVGAAAVATAGVLVGDVVLASPEAALIADYSVTDIQNNGAGSIRYIGLNITALAINPGAVNVRSLALRSGNV